MNALARQLVAALFVAMVFAVMCHDAQATQIRIWNQSGDTWQVGPGDIFLATVGLEVQSGDLSCGTFSAVLYPSWSGVTLHSTQVDVHAGEWQYRVSTSITAPEQVGSYTVRVNGVLGVCNDSTLYIHELFLYVEVWNNQDDPADDNDNCGVECDLNGEEYDFPRNAPVDREIRGKVEIENWSDRIYHIDRVELRVHRGSVDWVEDTNTRDFTLAPNDSRRVSGFRFIPRSLGRMTLDMYVKLENRSQWYYVGSIYMNIEPATQYCVQDTDCRDICADDSTERYGRRCVNNYCVGGSMLVCQDGETCVDGVCQRSCLVRDVRWQRERATDGDVVGIEINHMPYCDGRVAEVVVVETDGRLLEVILRYLIPGDQDRIPSRFRVILGTGVRWSASWPAVFTADFGETSEYRLEVTGIGNRTIRSSNVLMVFPFSRRMGAVADLFGEFPSPHEACPDYGYGGTVSSDCIHVRERAGVYGDVIDWDEVADTLMEGAAVLWIGSCLGCVGGALLCLATEAIACVPLGGIILGACTFCTGEAAVSTHVRREAAVALRVGIARESARARSRALSVIYRPVKHEVSPNGARITYQSDAVPVVEESLYQVGAEMASVRYKNAPWLYGVGGRAFLDFNTNKNALFVVEYERLSKAEARFFYDNFLRGNFQEAFDYGVRVLGDGLYTEQELFTRITITKTLAPQVYGETGPSAIHTTKNYMQFAVGSVLKRWEERASQTLVDHLLFHEIAHAISQVVMRTRNITLRGREVRIEPAVEYLNDAFVVSKLAGARLRNFREWNKQYLAESFYAADGSINPAIQRMIEDFAGEYHRRDVAAYELVALRARLRLFKLPKLETALKRALWTHLAQPEYASTRVEAQTLFEELTNQMVADGGLYSAGLLRNQLSDDLLLMLCFRYRFIECPADLVLQVGKRGSPG